MTTATIVPDGSGCDHRPCACEGWPCDPIRAFLEAIIQIEWKLGIVGDRDGVAAFLNVPRDRLDPWMDNIAHELALPGSPYKSEHPRSGQLPGPIQEARDVP
jgi:hypothetical protein